MADDAGTTIRASLEMVGKWVDQGLLTGINTADAGYLKLMQDTSKWVSSSTAGTQQVSAGMQTATNSITGYVQRYTSSMQTYIASFQQYGDVASNVLNTLANRAAQPANPMQSMATAMTTQIAGLFSLASVARALSSSLGELDMLQASYSRIVGASVGAAGAVGLTKQAMEDATAISFEYGASLKDVMSTMVELARLGNTPDQVRYLTQSLGELRLLLASGSGELLSMHRAMSSVVTMMNQFDATIFEAIQGMKLMAEYDIRTATSFDAIQQAMNRFAGAAKTANMTLTETIQVATAATEIGINGARAGTMLNSVLARVGSNKDAIKLMQDLGVSSVTVKDGMLAAASSMDQLLEAYRKAIDMGMNMREFAQAFAGLRLQSTFLSTMRVLDRRTRVQVDDEGFKRYTDQLETSLKAATAQAQLNVPLTVAPVLDVDTVKIRIQSGIDSLLDGLRTEYDATRSVSIGKFEDYVVDWLGVSEDDARVITTQYSTLFNSVRDLISAYSTDVESPYTLMRKAAEATTKALQDERDKAVETMTDTLEVAQTRLQTAWQSTFMQAGFDEAQKAALEQLTAAAIQFGNALMDTFNFTFSLGGLIDVETGIKHVGQLLRLYFGMKTAMMIGDVFSGAVKSLGVMVTRMGQLGGLVQAMRGPGVFRDYWKDSAGFIGTIQNKIATVSASMGALNKEIANMANIKMNSVDVPIDLKDFREQVSTALKSGWKGAGGSAAGLDATLRMTTGTLNGLKDAELTLGRIGETLERIQQGPRKGQGVLKQDMDALAMIIGPKSQNIHAAAAGYDQIKQIWGDLAAEVPKIDETMTNMRDIMNAPFAPDSLKQAATDVMQFCQQAMGAYHNFGVEVNRILGEVREGNIVPDDAIRRIEELADKTKTAMNVPVTEGAKINTVFSKTLVFASNVLNTLGNIVGAIGTVVAAWNLFYAGIRTVAGWLDVVKKRIEILKQALEGAAQINTSLNRQYDQFEKQIESSRLALEALQDDMVKVADSPTVLQLVLQLVGEKTGLADTDIVKAFDDTINNYIAEMTKLAANAAAEGRAVDASELQSPAQAFVTSISEAMKERLGEELTPTEQADMVKAVADVFLREDLDDQAFLDAVKKATGDILKTKQQKDDTARRLTALQTDIDKMSAASKSMTANLIKTLPRVLDWDAVSYMDFTQLMERLTAKSGNSFNQITIKDLATALSDPKNTTQVEFINSTLDSVMHQLSETFSQNTTLVDSFKATFKDVADMSAMTYSQFVIWTSQLEEQADQGNLEAKETHALLMSKFGALNVDYFGPDLVDDLFNNPAWNPDNLKAHTENNAKLLDAIREYATLQERSENLDRLIKDLEVNAQKIIDASTKRAEGFERMAEFYKALTDDIKSRITEGKKDGKDVSELEAELVSLQEQEMEARQRVVNEAANAVGTMMATEVTDAIMLPIKETNQTTKEMLAEARATLLADMPQIFSLFEQYTAQQGVAEELAKQGKTEAATKAQAKADELKKLFMDNLNALMIKLYDIDTQLGTAIRDKLGEMVFNKEIILNVDDWSSVKGGGQISQSTVSTQAKADGTTIRKVWDSTTKTIKDGYNQVKAWLVGASEAGGTAVAKLKAAKDDLGGSGTPPTLPTEGRGRQRDPIRDAISKIEADQKQAMSDLEIAFRTVVDAEGSIVKYLDRTETVEYAQVRIDLIQASITKLSELLGKATDQKHISALTTKIKSLSLEKVKLQADIDLTGVKRKIADLEFSIGVLEEGADAASEGANFEAARTFYQEAYERKLQILDEKMARVDKETLEYQSLELEKQALQMERHTKLAGLMADEYARALESEEKRSRIETFNTKFTMKAAVLYNWDEINAQMRVLGTVYENADAMLAEELNRLHDRIAEARAKIEAEADARNFADEATRAAYVTKRMGETEGLDINPFLDSMKKDIEGAINAVDVSVIKPGQKIFDPISREWIAPTLRNIKRFRENAEATMEAEYAQFEADLRASHEDDPTADAKIQTELAEWRDAKMAEIDEVERDLNESLSAIALAIGDALKSGWEEGFNIGLEHGITEEGWTELKKSIKRSIASQISQVLQSMIAKELTTVLTDMFTEMFKGLPTIMGHSIGGILGPMAGGVIGSLLGFLIGGMFTDFIEEQAEAQLKQQKDSVNAQGFGWSYQESDQATPYYQFAPDVTKESVNIINFRTTFNISTDAAQAMMAQRRELERVCTEIFNSMAKAASSTFGPKSAV